MIWIGFIAALCSAIATAHIKWFLDRSKMDVRTYITAQFLILFFGTSLLVPAFGRIDGRFFEFRNLFLFGLMVIVASIYNLYWTRGLSRETLHEYELIDILLPIFTIMLAALVFIDEREPLRLVFAAVAAGLFWLSHMHKFHIELKRADRWLLLGVFLMATEVLLVKPLLELMSPVTLYAFRTGSIALIFLTALRPRLRVISFDAWVNIVGNSIFGMLSVVLTWFVIQNAGILTAELAKLLAPMILAGFSVFLFKEHWTKLQIGMFVITIICLVFISLL